MPAPLDPKRTFELPDRFFLKPGGIAIGDHECFAEKKTHHLRESTGMVKKPDFNPVRATRITE